MSNTENTPEQATQITPSSWKRDENGLLPFVQYQYNSDASINWRKMIKPEYLVINKQNFTKRNAEVPKSIEGVEDKDLLILLGGIKDLAKLRGYTGVRHTPIVTSPHYCSVRTTIDWLANYETSGSVSFDALADATTQNTNGFAKLYLAAIAENRGFVRAVRNFLGINIAGQDEVGPAVEEENSNSNGDAIKFLDDILSRNKISFEKFKNRMIKEEVKGSQDWESLKDIPAEQVFDLANMVTTLLEKAK